MSSCALGSGQEGKYDLRGEGGPFWLSSGSPARQACRGNNCSSISRATNVCLKISVAECVRDLSRLAASLASSKSFASAEDRRLPGLGNSAR